MTRFQEVLYQYAEENLFIRSCQGDLSELRRAEAAVGELIRRLEDAGGETAQWAKVLRMERDTVETLHAQALFLAGLSLGLELGALCYGT